MRYFPKIKTHFLPLKIIFSILLLALITLLAQAQPVHAQGPSIEQKKALLFLQKLLTARANNSLIKQKKIHLFFDVDGVTTYQLTSLYPEEIQALRNNPAMQIVDFKPKQATNPDAVEPYLIAHGAAEIFGALAKLPFVELYFFSSAPDERTRFVLEQIKLPSPIQKTDGTTAYTVAQAASAIFSKHNLANPEDFIDKDITKLGITNFDPEWALIFDDWHLNIPAHLKKNFVFVTPSQPFFQKKLFDAEDVLPGILMTPPSKPEIDSPEWDWDLERARERNRLVRAVGIFWESLFNAVLENKTLAQAAQELQGSYENYRYDYTNRTSIFLNGRQIVRWYAPTFELAENHCKTLLLPPPRKQSVVIPAVVLEKTP